MRPPIVSLSLLCDNRTQDILGGTAYISWDKEIQTVEREEEKEKEKI